MILASENFIFDGISSEEFGILNVNMNSGMLSEMFMSSRSIKEEKIRGRDKPYFFGIEKDPFSFSLTFAFQDGYDEEKIRAVARWLCDQSYYKPMIFSEMPNRIFYCIVTDDITLVHNGLRQGYLELNFRCDSPYSYSHVFTDVFDTEDGRTIEIDNFGDLNCSPIIMIEKTVANGDVSIVNISNGGQEMKFEDILVNEVLTIDGEHESIETDVPTVHRYENHNEEFIELVRGRNILQLNGDFIVKFIYQFKLLAG